MTIRNSFILTLLASLVLMASGISFAVRFFAIREAETQFARESAAQLDRVEDIIHLSLDGAKQAVKNLATLPEARDAAHAPKAAGGPLHGREAALEQRLAVLCLLVPGVETAFCAYSDGSFHSSAPAPAPPGYDARTQPWYADTAWGLADVSVTEIAISRTSKSLAATLAAKIKDSGGDALGVAALTVSLGPLTDALRDIRLGRSARLLLFDGKGRVLFDPKTQENLLRDASEIDETMLALSRLPAGVHTVSTNSAHFAAASRTLEDSHWKIIVFMDKAEHDAFVRRLTLSAALASAALLLFLAPAGVFLARHATRPLHALITQSKALADGNADALTSIPGRGPDITALQGSIGMLTGRVMLLTQAEQRYAEEVEGYARKAARADQADRDFREVELAANRGAASRMAPLAGEASAALSGLSGLAGELRGHARAQTEAAINGRAETESLLDDAVTMARQAVETEKSAEAALARMQKADKLVRDMTNALEAAEETAGVLPHGLSAFRADSGQMAVLTASVRDIAEEINVLGLNLSIEISSAGENAGQLPAITDDMRVLAEKIMSVAGSMDNAVAVFEQNQTAHALAVNKNTTAVKRAAGGGDKARNASGEAAAAVGTVVEQIRVLSIALEGLAQPDIISAANTETALRAAEAASGTLRRLEESLSAAEAAAARLAALAVELETPVGNGPPNAATAPAKQTTAKDPRNSLTNE